MTSDDDYECRYCGRSFHYSITRDNHEERCGQSNISNFTSDENQEGTSNLALK